MLRTELYADPKGRFLHDLVLDSHFCVSPSYYLVAIFLANSWEFCTAFHGVQLACAIPTLLNPTYREREVRYQLENSGATVLITDAGNIAGINLAGLPNLRRVYTTRQPAQGTESFQELLQTRSGLYSKPEQSSDQSVAALPYSSGTTGLPKGVMLSHLNLVANIYQLLGPNGAQLSATDNILCCLPLYHIYGLNVILSPSLILGATLIVTPRFSLEQMGRIVVDEGVTMTWATAWATATARVASFPSAEAWTIALPFATAVTRPPCVTVATIASLLAYAMATPGMGAPWASSGTALMSRVSPRLVNGAAEVGVSETLATGGRDGPSVPQASRTERAMGQARRSGNPASSATILPGLTRRSRKGLTDGSARPYIARRSIHPLKAFAPPVRRAATWDHTRCAPRGRAKKPP